MSKRHVGPGFYMGPDLVYPQSGLLYVDWNGNVATDLSAIPATPAIGGSAVITGDAFHSVSPPTITAATRVSWTASKFNVLAPAQAFTLEAKMTFGIVANSTGRIIVELDYASPLVYFFQIVFYGAAPNPFVRWQQSVNGSLNILYTTPTTLSPSTTHHCAIVVPAGGSPIARLYLDGSLMASVGVQGLITNVADVIVGNPSDQGPENYAVDWLRLSAGELYTGSTYPVPPNV